MSQKAKARPDEDNVGTSHNLNPENRADCTQNRSQKPHKSSNSTRHSDQLTLFFAEDICAWRHLGNTESDAAFERIADELPKRRRRVYQYIKSRGLDGATAQECAEHFGIALHRISGRFSELKRDNMIRKIGVRNHGGVCVATEILAGEGGA